MNGGQTGLEDAAWGALGCSGIMLVCYVFFELGGGDLKLLTMIGAFLGWQRGLEALLWTFVDCRRHGTWRRSYGNSVRLRSFSACSDNCA